MNHVTQPKNSFWCWAACLSKMISGLNSPSRIGHEQCELVSFYKHYTFKLETRDWSTECCSQHITMPHGCNLALDQNDVTFIFNKGGFNTVEIDDLAKLNDFQYIKYKLKKNQSPIVLKTSTSGYGHMILINGYGERAGCEYILASNPIGALGERYLEFGYFKSQNSIDQAWETSVANRDNLGLDELLMSSIRHLDRFIAKHIKSMSYDKVLFDVWNYLSYEELPALVHFIEIESKESFESTSLLRAFAEDLKTQDNTVCKPKIIRNTVVFDEINFIPEQNFSNKMLRLGLNNESYFEDYATRVKVKEEEDKIFIRPISFPQNYSLNQDWQSYEDFYLDLTKLDNPKIEYFKDEKPLQGPALLQLQ